MSSALRETGIEPFGETPWGTHLCVFYETKQDLLDTAVPFFKAGLENEEFCLWAVSEPVTRDEALHALSKAVVDLDGHLAGGDIEIISGKEFYLNGGRVNFERILGAWDEKLADALARGYEGLRASGMAFWLESDHWKDFTAYEAALDTSIGGQQMIALCTYPLSASTPADVLEVVGAHQFTAARRNGTWDLIESPAHKRAQQLLTPPVPGGRAGNSSLRELIGKRIADLTPRERQVLELVVEGRSNKEIAAALGIARRTVETHRAESMRKIGARSIPELIRLTMIGELDPGS